MTKCYEWGTATNLTVCIEHGSHFGFLIFPGQRVWIARSTDFIAESVNVRVFCESCGRRKEILCDTERTVEEDLDQAMRSRRQRGFESLDPSQVPWIVENGNGIDVGSVPLPPVPLPAEGEAGVNQAFEYFVNRTYCCSICNAEFNGEGGFIERTQNEDSEDLFCNKCGCSLALSQSFAFKRAFDVSPFQAGIWSAMNVDIFWSHRNVEYDHFIPQVFWVRYQENRGHEERARIRQIRRQEEAKEKRRESGDPLLVIAVIVIVALMFLAAISSSGSFNANYKGMSGEEQLRYLEAESDDRSGSPY
jgi:hypothetical protein